jgi:hypothetical protein
MSTPNPTPMTSKLHFQYRFSAVSLVCYIMCSDACVNGDVDNTEMCNADGDDVATDDTIDDDPFLLMV